MSTKPSCAALIVAVLLSACGDDATARPGTPDAGRASSVRDSGRAAANDAASIKIDRSHLSDTGSDPLDYGDPALWLCKPGNDPNECQANIDATEFTKDDSQRLEQHVAAKKPAFDCFYAYPTVNISGQGNTKDFSNIGFILDALLAQAARFSRICEVYAPLYRQESFNLMGQLTGNPELSFGDVEAAFLYYMEHFNRGRKFVIIGHSQGTYALADVISKHIDADETLRAQMISALLIGGSIYAPEGQDIGGSFQHVPLCSAVGQTSCVIAYNSFAKEVPPNPDKEKGFAHAPAGNVNACTNPSLLAGNPGRYRGSYLAARANDPLFAPNSPLSMLPEVATPNILVRDMFRGDCIHRGDLSYLEISVDKSEDDQRSIPPYRYSLLEGMGLGMHTGDFSVEQDDLIDAVARQAKAMP